MEQKPAVTEYLHSVTLDPDKCKGCTTCIKRCPTEAIRVRDGKAIINPKHCIDCGECIRVCPYKAKQAIFDRLDELPKDEYLIALPPPSLFGQFDMLQDADELIQALIDIGFREVYEVARAAEIVTAFTRKYMERPDLPKPVINSACPVIVRLISTRFPSLCENVIQMVPPVELAGRLAKRAALRRHPELDPDKIKTVFISPCPAKVSWIKSVPNDRPSYVDYVVSMSEAYFRLVGRIGKGIESEHPSRTGMIGLGWATTGGESSALMNEGYLAADGIENVIRVLDEIENDKLSNVEFVELNACNGGCVGGALTVENPYIARVRLQSLRRYIPVSMYHPRNEDLQNPEQKLKELLVLRRLSYRDVSRLSDDRGESMRLLAEVERIRASLPGLDCGSCGAPTCRAFAEDIVRGEATEMDCIVRMREHFQRLLSEKEGEG